MRKIQSFLVLFIGIAFCSFKSSEQIALPAEQVNLLTNEINLTTTVEYRSKTASWSGDIASASFRTVSVPIGSGITSTYEGAYYTIYLSESEVKKVDIYYNLWQEANSPSSLLISTDGYDTEVFIPNYPGGQSGGGSTGGKDHISLNRLEP